MHVLTVERRPILRRTGKLAHLLVSLVFAAPISRAETLVEALARAPAGHPRIQGAQARAAAAREDVRKAEAGYLPTVAAHARAGFAADPGEPPFAARTGTRSLGYDVLATQPLFDGGRTKSTVGIAQANAAAAQAGSRTIAREALLAGVTAYTDVLSNRKLLTINERNVALLEQTARATRRQLGIRETTQADVALADAALAGARAQVEAARGSLAASEAAFEEALLHAPARLTQPPTLTHLLPTSREDAARLAAHENPVILVAVLRQQAAASAIDLARANLAPTVSLQAGYERAGGPIGDTDWRGGLVARVLVTVPIYSGGAGQAEVRAAHHSHAAAGHDADDTRAKLRAAVARTWSQMAAARAALGSIQSQHAASKIALAGILEERKVGQRSMTEQINAQQAVLSAETGLEQTRRTLYLATCTVLLLSGRLDLSALVEASRKTATTPAAGKTPAGVTLAENASAAAKGWSTHVRPATR